MLQIPAPNILQFVIDRPFAERPLISPFHYIDEACSLNHVFDVWRYQHVLPKLLASFDSKASQTMQYVIWSNRAVVRHEFRSGFTMLDVAAWGDMTVRWHGQIVADQAVLLEGCSHSKHSL